MNPEQIVTRLEELRDADRDQFASFTHDLVDELSKIDGEEGLATVAAIVGFMEGNPDLDYGAPGALTHFVEQFHRQGYEEILLNSVSRRPTAHTLWMLNRLLNGTADAAQRNEMISVLQSIASGGTLDSELSEQAARYLERHSKSF